jgi:hypothetical protein
MNKSNEGEVAGEGWEVKKKLKNLKGRQCEGKLDLNQTGG